MSFGALYPARSRFFAAIIASPIRPPHAILWFQGERDARFPAVQRATPERVTRPNVVDSEGLRKRRDGLHYATADQWELGLRFARALLPTLPTEQA